LGKRTFLCVLAAQVSSSSLRRAGSRWPRWRRMQTVDAASAPRDVLARLVWQLGWKEIERWDSLQCTRFRGHWNVSTGHGEQVPKRKPSHGKTPAYFWLNNCLQRNHSCYDFNQRWERDKNYGGQCNWPVERGTVAGFESRLTVDVVAVYVVVAIGGPDMVNNSVAFSTAFISGFSTCSKSFECSAGAFKANGYNSLARKLKAEISICIMNARACVRAPFPNSNPCTTHTRARVCVRARASCRNRINSTFALFRTRTWRNQRRTFDLDVFLVLVGVVVRLLGGFLLPLQSPLLALPGLPLLPVLLLVLRWVDARSQRRRKHWIFGRVRISVKLLRRAQYDVTIRWNVAKVVIATAQQSGRLLQFVEFPIQVQVKTANTALFPPPRSPNGVNNVAERFRWQIINLTSFMSWFLIFSRSRNIQSDGEVSFGFVKKKNPAICEFHRKRACFCECIIFQLAGPIKAVRQTTVKREERGCTRTYVETHGAVLNHAFASPTFQGQKKLT